MTWQFHIVLLMTTMREQLADRVLRLSYPHTYNVYDTYNGLVDSDSTML